SGWMAFNQPQPLSSSNVCPVKSAQPGCSVSNSPEAGVFQTIAAVASMSDRYRSSLSLRAALTAVRVESTSGSCAFAAFDDGSGRSLFSSHGAGNSFRGSMVAPCSWPRIHKRFYQLRCTALQIEDIPLTASFRLLCFHFLSEFLCRFAVNFLQRLDGAKNP